MGSGAVSYRLGVTFWPVAGRRRRAIRLSASYVSGIPGGQVHCGPRVSGKLVYAAPARGVVAGSAPADDRTSWVRQGGRRRREDIQADPCDPRCLSSAKQALAAEQKPKSALV